MGKEFNQNEIDRPHYIGKSFIDKKKNKKVRSIVVKFRSWEPRTAFYKARPRNHFDRQKKPGFKRRYNLLTKARGLASNNPLVAYAFSDINCSLVLKFNDNTFHYFNSGYELNNLPNSENNELFIV